MVLSATLLPSLLPGVAGGWVLGLALHRAAPCPALKARWNGTCGSQHKPRASMTLHFSKCLTQWGWVPGTPPCGVGPISPQPLRLGEQLAIEESLAIGFFCLTFLAFLGTFWVFSFCKIHQAPKLLKENEVFNRHTLLNLLPKRLIRQITVHGEDGAKTIKLRWGFWGMGEGERETHL